MQHYSKNQKEPKPYSKLVVDMIKKLGKVNGEELFVKELINGYDNESDEQREYSVGDEIINFGL